MAGERSNVTQNALDNIQGKVEEIIEQKATSGQAQKPSGKPDRIQAPSGTSNAAGGSNPLGEIPTVIPAPDIPASVQDTVRKTDKEIAGLDLDGIDRSREEPRSRKNNNAVIYQKPDAREYNKQSMPDASDRIEAAEAAQRAMYGDKVAIREAHQRYKSEDYDTGRVDSNVSIVGMQDDENTPEIIQPRISTFESQMLKGDQALRSMISGYDPTPSSPANESEETVPETSEDIRMANLVNLVDRIRDNVHSGYRVKPAVKHSRERQKQRAVTSTLGQVGARIYEKLMGEPMLDLDEVGIGTEDLRDLWELQPAHLYKLLEASGYENIPQEGVSFEEVLSFLHASNTRAIMMKPPDSTPRDSLLLRIRPLDGSGGEAARRRGIFLHPVMASIMNADFDGDSVNVSLDPDDRKFARANPLQWLVYHKKANMKLEFVHLEPIVDMTDVDGSVYPARKYVSRIMFAGLGIDDNSPVVDQVLLLSDCILLPPDMTTVRLKDYTTGEEFDVDASDALDHAYGLVISSLAEECIARNWGRDRFNSLVKAFYDDMDQRWHLSYYSRIPVNGEMVTPVTPDDKAWERMATDMVRGRAPNNAQEFRERMGFYLGYTSKGNPPFRCNATIAKGIRDDYRLQYGHEPEYEVVHDARTGEDVFVFDLGTPEVLGSLYRSTSMYALAYRMSGENRIIENRRVYNTAFIKRNVIDKVGFPDKADYNVETGMPWDRAGRALRFVRWLHAFVKEYNRCCALVNQANARFTTDMKLEGELGLSANPIKFSFAPGVFFRDIYSHKAEGDLGSDYLRESFYHLVLGDLVDPLLDVYGDYPMHVMFPDIVYRAGNIYMNHGADPWGFDFHQVKDNGKYGSPIQQYGTVQASGNRGAHGREWQLTEDEARSLAAPRSWDYKYHYIQNKYAHMTLKQFVMNNQLTQSRSEESQRVPLFDLRSRRGRSGYSEIDGSQFNRVFEEESYSSRSDKKGYVWRSHGKFYSSPTNEKQDGKKNTRIDLSSGIEMHLIFAMADKRTSKASSYAKRQYGGATDNKGQSSPHKEDKDKAIPNVPWMMAELIYELNTLEKSGELAKSPSAADDVIAMLWLADKDMMTEFGLDGIAGWRETEYGRLLRQAVPDDFDQVHDHGAGSREIANIMFVMKLQYTMKEYHRKKERWEAVKDGDADVTEVEKENAHEEYLMAREKLANASMAFGTVIDTIDGDCENEIIYLIERARGKYDTNFELNAENAKTVDGSKKKGFWSDYCFIDEASGRPYIMGKNGPVKFSIEAILFELSAADSGKRSSYFDLDMKCRILSDLVRVHKHDITFQAYEVPLQLSYDNASEFEFMSNDGQSFFTPQNQMKARYNQWENQRWSNLKEDYDTAKQNFEHDVDADGRPFIVGYLDTLAREPWKYLASNNAIFADACMAVYDKRYGNSEKSKDNQWANTCFAQESYVRNDGFHDSYYITDDRALGLLNYRQLTGRDVIRALSDPDFSIEIYFGGKSVTLDMDFLLGEGVSKLDEHARAELIWKFLDDNLRIAGSILPTNIMCVSSDVNGTGFVGRKNDIDNSLRAHKVDTVYDWKEAIRFHLHDHPDYYGLVNLLSSRKNQTTQKGRDRVVYTDDYLVHLIGGLAQAVHDKKDVGGKVMTVSSAAEHAMSMLGITQQSLYELFRKTRGVNALLDAMVDDGVITEQERSDMFDRDDSAQRLAGQMYSAIKDGIEINGIRNGGFVKWIGELVDLAEGGECPFTKGAGFEFPSTTIPEVRQWGRAIDTSGVVSYWDTVSELSGAKTEVTTGIEGMQTYNHAIQTALVSVGDRYADLNYIISDIKYAHDNENTEDQTIEDEDRLIPSEDFKNSTVIIIDNDDTPTYQVAATVSDLENIVEDHMNDGKTKQVLIKVPQVAIDHGFVVRDGWGSLLRDYQMNSLDLLVSEHRGYDAEDKSLKVMKSALDALNSIAKLSGKFSGADYNKIVSDLQNMYDALEVKPEDGEVPDELIMHLAKILYDVHREFGYKQFTFDNFANSATYMLIINSNGEVVLRSHEMIFDAIESNLMLYTQDMDGMGLETKDVVAAARQMMLDRDAVSCIGGKVSKPELAKDMALSAVAPTRSSNHYNALHQGKSSTQRRLEFYSEIIENEIKNGREPVTNDALIEKIDLAYRRDVRVFDPNGSKTRWGGESKVISSKGYNQISTFMYEHPTISNLKVVNVVGLLTDGQELVSKTILSDEHFFNFPADMTDNDIVLARMAAENEMLVMKEGSSAVDWKATVGQFKVVLSANDKNVIYGDDVTWKASPELSLSYRDFPIDRKQNRWHHVPGPEHVMAVDSKLLNVVGDKNVTLVFDNATEEEIASVLEHAYRLGLSVVFSDGAVNTLSKMDPRHSSFIDDGILLQRVVKDEILMEDALLIDMTDIRMNGGERHPLPFRFAVEQVSNSRIAICPQLPEDYFNMGDSGIKPLKRMKDMLVNMAEGKQTVRIDKIFSQGTSSKYQEVMTTTNYDYRMILPTVETVYRELKGESYASHFIDYGMPESNTVQWFNRVRQINRGIQRYLERVEAGQADEYGMLTRVPEDDPLQSWEIVGMIGMKRWDKEQRGYVTNIYAPLIPFDPSGAKNVPNRYVITGEVKVNDASVEIPWKNVDKPSYVKVLGSESPANKGVASLDDADGEAYLGNGVPITMYNTQQTSGSRFTPEEATLSSVCSSFEIQRLIGYNYAAHPDSFPNHPDIKMRILRGHRNDEEAVSISEWRDLIANDETFLISRDRVIDAFLKYEAKKFIANGTNPTDIISCRIAPDLVYDGESANVVEQMFEDAKQFNTLVKWEYRATVESDLNWEQLYLRWMHSMFPYFPESIDDTGEDREMVRINPNVPGLIEYKVGIPGTRVDARTHQQVWDWDDMKYIWCPVSAGEIGLTEDASSFSTPNVIGQLPFDATVASALGGNWLNRHMVMWASQNHVSSFVPNPHEPIVSPFIGEPPDTSVAPGTVYKPDVEL